ncbi:MAG: hypothetical protein HY246_02585 [Proteobacteria bacterium]|nr:hypothetical protein [Pseudomonadota bacterium]
MDDIAICAAIQRNLDAGIYAGPLNGRHETAVRHFHDLVRTATD